jgi:hypothetical protein
LDLVVEFSSMSPSEHAGACFGLLEELEYLFLVVQLRVAQR